MVGITHFAKSTGGRNPAERVIGSQAFTAFARMTIVSQKDQESGECILARAKSNISVDSGGSASIGSNQRPLRGGSIETTRIQWLEAADGERFGAPGGRRACRREGDRSYRSSYGQKSGSRLL